MNTKNKLLWMILFVLIAGATIWTLTSQNRSFSFAAFRAYLQEMNSGWLAAAAASSAGAGTSGACRPAAAFATTADAVSLSSAALGALSS